MVDRERVIKGLECCREMSGDACQKCPYISDCDNLSAGVPHLTHDALELIKEQEAEIERLEHDLAVTEDNINHYVNGND